MTRVPLGDGVYGDPDTQAVIFAADRWTLTDDLLKMREVFARTAMTKAETIGDAEEVAMIADTMKSFFYHSMNGTDWQQAGYTVLTCASVLTAINLETNGAGVDLTPAAFFLSILAERLLSDHEVGEQSVSHEAVLSAINLLLLMKDGEDE